MSLLPWLHTKFIVFLAIFGVALAWRLLRRPFDNNGPDAQGRLRALVAFYERHGFHVQSRVDLPDGPPVWTMWREPDGVA